MTRPERPLALVTGASRGIGRAIAASLAPGHDLALVARRREALADIESEATAAGATVHPLAADLAVASERDALVAALGDLPAPVTILVNNAGIAPSAPLAKTTTASFEGALAVNATAPFELMRATLPGMKAAGWGRIVTIASTSALKGYRYTAAYSASKGAVLALTRAVAAEVAGRGITVNAICPGFTDTDIAAAAIRNISAATGRAAQEARSSLEAFSPQQRLIAPAEVATLCAYLVSDAAAGIHGQALALDGGETTL